MKKQVSNLTLSRQEDGSDTIRIPAADLQTFLNGKMLYTISGNCYGRYQIRVQLVRPRSKAKRFPVAIYGENYQPPKKV